MVIGRKRKTAEEAAPLPAPWVEQPGSGLGSKGRLKGVSLGLMPDHDSDGVSGAVSGSNARLRPQPPGTMEAVASLALLAVIACSLAADQAAWPGHGFLSFMDLIAGLGAAGLAFRALHRGRTAPRDDSYQEIFDSAGPMVITIGLDGAIAQINPAAQRLLGYFAEELVGKPRTAEILAPGEGPRLVAELQRLTGIEPDPDLPGDKLLDVLVDTVRRMPPSQVPSFEGQFRRKDGSLFPVTFHMSSLRDEQAALKGLVVVALDQTGTLRQDRPCANPRNATAICSKTPTR